MNSMEALIARMMEDFDLKHKNIMEKALQQAVITGECLIKFNDNNEFEIINPFKGCECGE
jgi:hypothetical protein